MDEKSAREQVLVQMYGTYVSAITANENRRQQTSVVYFGLVTAILAAASVKDFDPLLLAMGGAVMASFWKMKIQFFTDLAAAKWDALAEIEAQLPSRPFEVEYAKLKDIRSHLVMLPRDLTKIELLAPEVARLVAIGYVIYRFFRWAFDPGTAAQAGQ